MATTEEQLPAEPPAHAYPVTEVQALQGWHLARQAAKRYNRNLLQYGAGLTAVLGISAGAGGMLQLAKSLAIRTRTVAGEQVTESAPTGWTALGVWPLVLTALAASCLLVLLIAAYRDRQRAERGADEYAVKLIAIRPENFRNGEE